MVRSLDSLVNNPNPMLEAFGEKPLFVETMQDAVVQIPGTEIPNGQEQDKIHLEKRADGASILEIETTDQNAKIEMWKDSKGQYYIYFADKDNSPNVSIPNDLTEIDVNDKRLNAKDARKKVDELYEQKISYDNYLNGKLPKVCSVLKITDVPEGKQIMFDKDNNNYYFYFADKNGGNNGPKVYLPSMLTEVDFADGNEKHRIDVEKSVFLVDSAKQNPLYQKTDKTNIVTYLGRMSDFGSALLDNNEKVLRKTLEQNGNNVYAKVGLADVLASKAFMIKLNNPESQKAQEMLKDADTLLGEVIKQGETQGAMAIPIFPYPYPNLYPYPIYWQNPWDSAQSLQMNINFINHNWDTIAKAMELPPNDGPLQLGPDGQIKIMKPSSKGPY